MKKLLGCILVFAGCVVQSSLYAQDIEKEFAEFEKKQQQEFEQFKNKADQDFENFLRETWEKFDAFKPLEVPLRPEPPQPVEFDPAAPEAEPVAVPVGDEHVPEVEYNPVEVDLPAVSPDEKAERVSVVFYGTQFKVAVAPVADLRLAGITETDVADAWKYLCGKEYEPLLYDCLSIKKQYRLNDWAYLLFTKAIGTHLYGASDDSRVTFLQMFLLSKSGYKVRLAKIDNELRLLVATADDVYGVPYLTVNGLRYYVFEPREGSSMSVYTYRHDFADAQKLIHLGMLEVPELTGRNVERTLAAEGADWNIHLSVSQNLIDFYRDYPQCAVAIHYHTPLSDVMRENLYGQMKSVVAGKSQKEAAALLLHFVQTAFQYKTDGEQFGFEKPNFLDETFYYPYCDCEDRAMLYATLVKDLLGLDVVLLDYPNHIASAVRFSEEVSGDYIQLENGHKYIICDPTYIGAPVGACMEQYRKVAPEVIR